VNAAPRDVAAFTTFSTRLSGEAPRMGRLFGYEDLPCAFWPLASTRRPSPVHAPGAPPIVVVAATGDPATPYAWGVSLARQLTSSVLVTRDGEGHTSYLTDACITSVVDDYLLKLKVPKAGLRCD
jgi:hypothetical protein